MDATTTTLAQAFSDVLSEKWPLGAEGARREVEQWEAVLEHTIYPLWAWQDALDLALESHTIRPSPRAVKQILKTLAKDINYPSEKRRKLRAHLAQKRCDREGVLIRAEKEARA